MSVGWEETQGNLLGRIAAFDPTDCIGAEVATTGANPGGLGFVERPIKFVVFPVDAVDQGVQQRLCVRDELGSVVPDDLRRRPGFLVGLKHATDGAHLIDELLRHGPELGIG